MYEAIGRIYNDKHPELKALHLLYSYNDGVEMHEMFSYQDTNFIRDDERFQNRRFSSVLGKPFPMCLGNICMWIRSNCEAIEVAKELRVFFHDDSDLMYFADWLDKTAAHCSTYELSW